MPKHEHPPHTPKTFHQLEADAAYMRARESYLLSSYTDADLVDLFREQALADMEIDILNALDLQHEEQEILDNIALRHDFILQRALAIKQLWYVLNDAYASEGVNKDKFDYYTKEYNEIKTSFRGLIAARSGMAYVRQISASL